MTSLANSPFSSLTLFAMALFSAGCIGSVGPREEETCNDNRDWVIPTVDAGAVTDSGSVADSGFIFTAATEVAAGANHTCAIQNYRLMCWGDNSRGQLGNASTTNSDSPVGVTGMDHDVTAVAAGNAYTCAIQSGALKCWGNNTYGRLGVGPGTMSSPIPLQVVGMTSGLTTVSANNWHTCAIQNGSLKCWGYNADSEIGDGTVSPSNIPVQTIGMTADVAAVSVGGNHSCAIKSGALTCWGDDQAFQLGYGPFGMPTPTPVIAMDAGVTAIAAGQFHTCAIQNGAAKCWGNNGYYQVGNGGAAIPYGSWGPVQVVGMTSNVTTIASGMSHACAIQTGALKCWGLDDSGQLGIGGSTASSSPAQVIGLNQAVTKVSTSSGHTCAIQNGTVKCWGLNTSGQLGDGTHVNSNTPVTCIIR